MVYGLTELYENANEYQDGSDPEFKVTFDFFYLLTSIGDIIIDIINLCWDSSDAVQYIGIAIGSLGSLTPLAIWGLFVLLLDLIELSIDVAAFSACFGDFLDSIIFEETFRVDIKLFSYYQDRYTPDFGGEINWTDVYLILYNVVVPIIAFGCCLISLFIGPTDPESFGGKTFCGIIGLILDYAILVFGTMTYFFHHPEKVIMALNLVENLNNCYKYVKKEVKNGLLCIVEGINNDLYDEHGEKKSDLIEKEDSMMNILIKINDDIIEEVSYQETGIIVIVEIIHSKMNSIIEDMKTIIIKITTRMYEVISELFYVFYGTNPFPYYDDCGTYSGKELLGILKYVTEDGYPL